MNTTRGIVSFALLFTTLAAQSQPARAENVIITAGGRVSIELIYSSSDWSNTLALVSPAAGRAVNGCITLPAQGLSGAPLLSEKASQRGCRVELDYDLAAPGVQPFPPNTALEFQLCAQTDTDAECEFVWSSNPANNGAETFDHARITPITMAGLSGQAFQINWEDLPGGGDQDFNDMVVVVRSDADTDGDGLWDDWEQRGIDRNGDGSIDLNLPALGANPLRKDIFTEIDYMDCAVAGSNCAPGETLSHRPKAAAIQAVIDAFAKAPVINPDGSKGIALHVDVDDAIPMQKVLSLGCNNLGSAGFDAVKGNPAYFGLENPRRFAFHYALFAHRQSATSTAAGCAEKPGNDFIVTLGEWNSVCVDAGQNRVINSTGLGDDIRITDAQDQQDIVVAGPNLICDTRATGDDVQVVAQGSTPPADLDNDGLDDRRAGTVQQQAAALMHELGHNLGLDHGGDDDVNRKPNYQSVMNYSYMNGLKPLDPDGAGPLMGRVDYSRMTLRPLDEAQLDENTGVALQGDGNIDESVFYCGNGDVVAGPIFGPTDWSCDGRIASTQVIADINRDQQLGTLSDFNDWANLRYTFQDQADYEEGVHSTTPTRAERDYMDFAASPGAVDLTVAQVVTPAIAVAGERVRITAMISNTGTAPATGIQLVSVLPSGFTVSSVQPAGTCVHDGRTITCTLPSLAPLEQAQWEIDADVDPALPDGSTAITTLTATPAINEVDRSNNTAVTNVRVLRVSRPRAFLPLIARAPAATALPDLVVKSISITNAGAEVVIQNIGAGAVALGNDFWVDLYINPPQAPTGVNQTWQTLRAAGGLVWGVVGSRLPLAPGQTMTLRSAGLSYAPAESAFPDVIPSGSRIYVQVDSANIASPAGAVLEASEQSGEAYNNIGFITTSQTISTNAWPQTGTQLAQMAMSTPSVQRP